MANEKLEVISCSGIYKTIYLNGSYFLFGKKRLLNFEVSCDNML